ncbi:TspO/MBR family protein [Acidiphilium acidophilum DSM 700]|nr:TspO/MBR family protein [Acidiphilium acidophilum DSM 700]
MRHVTFFSGNWGPVLVAAGAAAVTALAGGLATRLGPWYWNLRKPSWQPPPWLFGPVWTIIFALIAAAGVISWESAPDRASAALVIGLFALNAVVNVAWSVLFFAMRRPDWALIDIFPLWLSIAALIIAMQPYAARASLLLVPYLLWVSFAGFLNWTIVRLNAPFGAVAAVR